MTSQAFTNDPGVYPAEGGVSLPPPDRTISISPRSFGRAPFFVAGYSRLLARNVEPLAVILYAVLLNSIASEIVEAGKVIAQSEAGHING